MSAYKVFLASIVFFALFTGATQFQQGFFEGQNLNTQDQTQVQSQYDKLGDKIDQLRSDVRSVRTPDSLSDVAAGLYLVPNFLTLIMSPITILASTIDAIVAQHAFIPGFVGTGLKYLIYTVISWSAFRLLVGLRG